MDWQDRRDIRMAEHEEAQEKIEIYEMLQAWKAAREQERKVRTRWEEFDVADIGRLMMAASQLAHDVDDFNPMCQHSGPGSDRDFITDAQYHAHKLYSILAHLAIKAEREYREAVAAEEA